eukprot:3272568-Rhodomonas_salina.1
MLILSKLSSTLSTYASRATPIAAFFNVSPLTYLSRSHTIVSRDLSRDLGEGPSTLQYSHYLSLSRPQKTRQS